MAGKSEFLCSDVCYVVHLCVYELNVKNQSIWSNTQSNEYLSKTPVVSEDVLKPSSNHQEGSDRVLTSARRS